MQSISAITCSATISSLPAQVDVDAPDVQLLALKYITRWVGRVGRAQHNLLLLDVENLDQRIAVEAGNHHLLAAWLQRLVDQHQVPVENAEPRQAMAGNLSEINLWAVQFEKLVELDSLLQVILGRAGKPGGHGW